jgi:hypothetical protein
VVSAADPLRSLRKTVIPKTFIQTSFTLSLHWVRTVAPTVAYITLVVQAHSTPQDQMQISTDLGWYEIGGHKDFN